MYSGSGGGADRSERRRRRGSRHQVRAREDDAPHELYASRSGPQLGPSNSRGAAPESFVTGFLEANSELSSPSERSTLHSPVAGDLSDIVRNGSNPVASSAGIRTVDLADIARNVSNQPAPSAGSRSFDLDGLFAEDRFAAGKPSDEIPKWLDPPSVSMTDPSSSFRTPEFSDPELQKQVVIDKSAIRSKPVALMPYDMPVPHPGATKQKQLVLTKEWPEEMNIAMNFTKAMQFGGGRVEFPELDMFDKPMLETRLQDREILINNEKVRVCRWGRVLSRLVQCTQRRAFRFELCVVVQRINLALSVDASPPGASRGDAAGPASSRRQGRRDPRRVLAFADCGGG